MIDDTLPKGYAHLTSFYGREHSSGQRYDVTVVIMHNDSRVARLRPKDAQRRWSDDIHALEI